MLLWIVLYLMVGASMYVGVIVFSHLYDEVDREEAEKLQKTYSYREREKISADALHKSVLYGLLVRICLGLGMTIFLPGCVIAGIFGNFYFDYQELRDRRKDNKS